MKFSYLLLTFALFGLFACNNSSKQGQTEGETTDAITETTEAAGDAVEGATNAIGSATGQLGAVAGAAAKAAGDAANTAGDAAKGAADATKDAVEGAGDSAKDAVEGAAEKATALVGDSKEEIEEAVKKALKTAPSDMKFVKVGEAAPMTKHKMKDISGKDLALADIKGDNGLLVMFSCNTCPYVIGWEDRYTELAAMCKENNIGMVTVNSNEAKREGDDSFDAMQAHAKEKDYKFAYVMDNGSSVAKNFGATRTPDVFLLDKDMNVVYKGAIDDNMEEAAKVKKPYLKNAIQQMIDGKPIEPSQTKSIGCTIKWKKA